MPDRLVLTAHAKVNLTLEILGKRPDGFHEIRSVMQRISLADTLTIEASDRLSLRCDDPTLESESNLVWRAAQVLNMEARGSRGAAIHLEKRVPIAAGLGGGSSDCAAALRGLARLWNLDLSPSRLGEIGAQLGSDVPFFLSGTGCALSEGRGERLTTLAPLPVHWMVLVKPDVGISAGAAYGAVKASHWSDGARTLEWLSAARAVGPAGTLPAPFNALETAALSVQPSAGDARQALLDAGALAPVMSGSGSTYFALADREEDANQIARRLRLLGWSQVWVVSFVTL